MRRVTVTELKNRLSEFLRLVKQGETLEVLERSVPVARIEGIPIEREMGDDLLNRLVRDGVVERARRPPAREILDEPPVECALDPVQILIEERGER